MSIFESIHNFFDSKWHKQIFIYMLYLSYFLLAISITGVMKFSPLYVSLVRNVILYYVCLVLIGRFNPFVYNQTSFDKFDRKIAFSAGLTLFLTTSAAHIFENYFISTIHSIKL